MVRTEVGFKVKFVILDVTLVVNAIRTPEIDMNEARRKEVVVLFVQTSICEPNTLPTYTIWLVFVIGLNQTKRASSYLMDDFFEQHSATYFMSWSKRRSFRRKSFATSPKRFCVAFIVFLAVSRFCLGNPPILRLGDYFSIPHDMIPFLYFQIFHERMTDRPLVDRTKRAWKHVEIVGVNEEEDLQVHPSTWPLLDVGKSTTHHPCSDTHLACHQH